MKPGDTFMGLDLAAGGHLTHGAKPNMSGKWFNVVSYGVRPDDLRIDMEALARLAPEKPTITSGIRLGTAAATSRGFGQKEFETVGRLIAEVLDAVAVSNDGTAPMVEAAVKQKVAGLTAAFPIYRTRSD
jgi:glycine hydroxymethyltransferase